MKTPQLPTVLLLTLLPWPAVWIGLYQLHSAVGTFALYHGLCLLPGVVAGRSLWSGQLIAPSRQDFLIFCIAAIVVPALAVGLSYLTGDLVVSKDYLLASLRSRGYTDTMLIPISLYLIFVNGPLEEFFWRGVIYNLESEVAEQSKRLWEIWTAISFAGWHFLVLQMLLNPGWALPMTVLFTSVGYFLGRLMRHSRSLILVSLWHGIVFDGAVIAVFLAVLAR